jgi:hypothetical protein
MTQPTLLARLYKFIAESRSVRLTDLKGRFPEEFTEPAVRSQHHLDPHRSDSTGSANELGRLSQSLSDALRFLLAEEVVVVNRRGRLVHVNAWKEKSRIRIERAHLGQREILGN